MHGTGTGRTSTLDEMPESTAASTGASSHPTLRPVTPPFVAQVAPLRRDVTYNHTTQTAQMPVEVRFSDGSTARTDLVMNPSQLHAASVQIERAITARETARSRSLGPL